MRVVALFAKRRARAPMARQTASVGIGGHGLAGDLHASAASPRQVLIAGADDVRSLGLRDDALRANILVDGGVQGLSSGDVIAVGSLQLRVTMWCEACHRLEDEQRGLAKIVGARRGVLARVLDDGTAREGDAVTMVGQLPALPAHWHDRVREIVCEIPAGTVVTYAGLAEVAGVQRAYCRALPTVLRKAALAGAPTHRVVPADLDRISPEAARRLAEDGVNLAALTHWSTAELYACAERRYASGSTRRGNTGAKPRSSRIRRPSMTDS
jgi:alkylated DNA nucleotide flippase Atl1